MSERKLGVVTGWLRNVAIGTLALVVLITDVYEVSPATTIVTKAVLVQLVLFLCARAARRFITKLFNQNEARLGLKATERDTRKGQSSRL